MLAMTMLLMSIPTMCMGMLPTYTQIGLAAPILLISLRVLQGIALGGEFGASCVYLYESVPYNKRGFFGTLALTGVGMGLVLSACTILLVESIFTSEEVFAYAWRIPFFVSVFGSLIGFYMRNNLLETDDFVQMKRDMSLVKNPFGELMKNHKAKLIGLFSIFITTQISFFVVFIFGKTMMIDFLHFDSKIAGKFNLFTVMSYTVATVIFGYLSDKINKRYLILMGAAGILCSAYPFIVALQNGSSSAILGMSILMGALIGLTEGTLNPLTAESFPTNIRATSVAFSWNFTSVVFGSAAPIIAMWLMNQTGETQSVAYYLMGVCSVTIVGSIIMIMKQSSKGNLLPLDHQAYQQ
jgi:MHS family proline/betaine transporter-like MFS transporter